MILRERLKSLAQKSKILVKFYFYYLVIYLILMNLEPLLIYPTAYLTYSISKLFLDVQLLGNIIIYGNNRIEIIEPCTGTFLIALFLSLSFLYSKSFKSFLFSLIFAFLAYLINILRLVLSILLSNKYGNFEVWHDLVGYSVISIFSFLLALIYIKILRDNYA
ncbi:Exosortase EpsH-related protein [Methanocaldococcus infernus ME]|uniref:Exosortase EpsH-related protein n=1 Tax=Methanocaldococcus infernus (strain DSM 11812 / JCM 15783 / ME) TaxID=573063 RepID=D5VR59_METIM|nr:Exosortase EpsH-related protein [Methanocaldococcus infernus ME]